MEKKTKKEFTKLFWIFVVASIIGCLVETIVCIIVEGSFKVRQGVIYGPFIPVYGVGAVLFYLVVPKITGATVDNVEKISNKKIFIYTMILGGITEYIFSYAQECIFGTVSWEYGDMLFNLNGRTSLVHCIYWGLGGVLFIKWLYPYTKKLDELDYNNRNVQVATIACLIFMIFNITISCLAGVRQYERTMQIEANSKLERFLDEHYPDAIMDVIFSNKQNKQDLNRKTAPTLTKRKIRII